MTTQPENARQWGAHPDDWRRLVELGYTRDLLPVVSDPNARIAPYSKMKALGKTPSRYSERDMVAGIPNWTERQTTREHVANWQREPNYGICLQTRRVRALDIDLNEPEQAERAERLFLDALSLLGAPDVIPRRVRSNSGKRLLAFRIAGEGAHPVGGWTKRVLRVEGGLVEFLADGQQFVAHGTHPSGVRYEWEHLPEPVLGEEFPVLTPAEFEAAWSALVDAFAGEVTETRPAAVLRERRLPPTEPDPVAQFLDGGGWVLSQMRDGRLNVRCPFEDQHTSESNETATQYFPAGTGGFERGHWRCLHAHCAHRTDDEFLSEVGYIAAQFEVAEPGAPAGDGVQTGAVVEAPQGEEDAWPVLSRNREGRIFATIGNVVRAIAAPTFVGYELRLDTFRDEIMLREVHDDVLAWRSFTDADYTAFRLQMERRGFMPVGRELVRDAVLSVANEQRFDSAQAWLTSLPPWDGVPRVEEFFTHYAAVEDDAGGYARAVGLYWWSAMAGRVMSPGCQVDMVPILVGAQGAGKTSLARAVVPSQEFFAECNLSDSDVEQARKLRGRLVAELAELRGLRTKELETIKSFITRTHEQWRPAYREFLVTYPRRVVYIGTTNEDEFLADNTGNRRWLPLQVVGGSEAVDAAGVARDREQLWAEGLVLWRRNGVMWREAHERAGEVRERFRLSDSWDEALERWATDASCGTPPAEAGFTTHDALVGALGFDLKRANRADEMRAAGGLARLGFHKTRRYEKGVRNYVWKKV